MIFKLLCLATLLWLSLSTAQPEQVYMNTDPLLYALDTDFTPTVTTGSYSTVYCFNLYYGGKLGGGSSIMRQFDPVRHYQVDIYFEVLVMDAATTVGSVFFSIDDVQYGKVDSYTAYYYGSPACQGPSNDLRQIFSYSISHNDPSITFKWESSMPTTQFFGIGNLRLVFYKCIDLCDLCVNGYQCLRCDEGYFANRADDGSDTCIACPAGAQGCEMDQSTGILTLWKFFDEENPTFVDDDDQFGFESDNPTNSFPTTTCEGNLTSGVYDKNYVLIKELTGLKRHVDVQVKMDGYILGSWSNDAIVLEVANDGGTDDSQEFSSGSTADICTGYTGDYHSIVLNTTASDDDHDEMVIEISHEANGRFAFNSLEISISICQDEHALTCSAPFISETCQSGYFARTFNEDYKWCQACVGGVPECYLEELTELDPPERHFTIYSFRAKGFDESNTGWEMGDINYDAVDDEYECDGDQYFGPFQKSETIERTFTSLLPHFRYKVIGRLFLMDYWDEDRFRVLDSTSTTVEIYHYEHDYIYSEENICDDRYGTFEDGEVHFFGYDNVNGSSVDCEDYCEFLLNLTEYLWELYEDDSSDYRAFKELEDAPYHEFNCSVNYQYLVDNIDEDKYEDHMDPDDIDDINEYVYEDLKCREDARWTYQGYDKIYEFESDWVDHSGSTLSLMLASTLNSQNNEASWGLAEFGVVIQLCQTQYCDICNGDDDCQQCAAGSYQIGWQDNPTTPVCDLYCSGATWQNIGTNTCDDCTTGCEDCNDGTSCNYCAENWYMNAGVCDEDCPAGTYGYDFTRTCEPCPDKCTTCTSPSNCDACEPGNLHVDGRYCLSFCPEGQYPNIPTQSCETCHTDCFGCTAYGDNFCTSCNPNTYLEGTECVADCAPYGKWNDNLKNVCGECDEACDECYGYTNAECDSCNEGWYLFEGTTCVKECEEDQYANEANNECVDCHTSCKTCANGSDETDCTSCNEGTYLTADGECLSSCPTGYFANDTDLTCHECNSTCRACSSLEICTACNDGWYYQDQSCNLKCRTGTYPDDDSNRCLGCDDTCFTCSGSSTHCTSCDEGERYMHQNTCVKKCPDGFYEGATECKACPSSCTLCDSEFDCTECQDDYILEGGRCQLTDCEEPCRTCDGDTSESCLSCYEPLVLQGQKCQDECETGYQIKSASELVCVPCEYECTVCIEGYFRYGDRCLESCPEDTEEGILEEELVCITNSNAPAIELLKVPLPKERGRLTLKRDLVIETEVSAAGGIPNVWWSSQDVPLNDFNKLMTGVDNNATTLLIPRENLLSDYTYTLIVNAEIDGFASLKSFTFQTVSRIQEGTFELSLTEGEAYTDQFTVTIDGWTQPDGTSLTFEIYTYYEVFDADADESVQKQILTIAQGITEAQQPYSKTFRFPAIRADRTQFIEVEASSDTDFLEVVKQVSLKKTTTEELGAQLALLANNADSGYEITVAVSATMLLYDSTPEQKATTKSFAKIAKNYATLTKQATYCPNDLYCSNQGECSIDEDTSVRICTCNEGFAGLRCELTAENFANGQDIVQTLLQKVLAQDITSSTLGTLIGNLQMLTTQVGFYEPNQIISIISRLKQLSESEFLKKSGGIAIIETLSNILGSAQDIPELKKNSRQLTKIIDLVSDFLVKKLSIGGKFRIATDSYESTIVNPADKISRTSENSDDGRILLVRVSPRRIPERKEEFQELKESLNLTTTMGGGFELPTLKFSAKEQISFAVQNFEENQIDASNAGGMISQTTALKISDGSEEIPVSNLPEPIIMRIPKITPMDPKKTTSLKFVCAFYDKLTNRFKKDGCEYLGESKTHIICQCDHLTEFGAMLDEDQVISEDEIQNLQNQVSVSSLVQDQLDVFEEQSAIHLQTFKEKSIEYRYIPIERKFHFHGLFFSVPLIIIATIWIIIAYKKPRIDKDKSKAQDFMRALQQNQQDKEAVKTYNGITAAALFSCFVKRVVSLMYPRHIRILYFAALMSFHFGFAAIFAFLGAGPMSAFYTATNQVIGSLVLGLLTAVLSNFWYDLVIGFFNKKFVRERGDPDTNEEANTLARKQFFYAGFWILGFASLPIVMLFIEPDGANYFGIIVLFSVVVDFFVVDIAVWVYFPSSKRKFVKFVLRNRGFFIEDMVEIQKVDDMAFEDEEEDDEEAIEGADGEESEEDDIPEDPNSPEGVNQEGSSPYLRRKGKRKTRKSKTKKSSQITTKDIFMKKMFTKADSSHHESSEFISDSVDSSRVDTNPNNNTNNQNKEEEEIPASK